MTDLTLMDIAFDGQPFVEGAFRNGADLFTMDYAFNGQPFVRDLGGTPPVVDSFIPWICLM